MKKLLVLILIIVLAAAVFCLPGCSIIREGITGERQTDVEESEPDEPFVTPAFNIIGDWFGVYAGSEYLAVRFTADGKCELQPALYPSDMFGARYYGDYRWGGDNGDEIILDMYKGESRALDFGDDNVFNEWSDGGRESATTGLSITFRVIFGQMRSFALKTDLGGVDTEGYTVVQRGALIVMLNSSGGSGNQSPFLAQATPYIDNNEDKTMTPKAPDSFTIRTERYFTTAELNVRCGPSTDFGTYGTVPSGTPVDKIAYMATGHDDWAFVLLMDGGGWVHKDYLADGPPAPVADTADTE